MVTHEALQYLHTSLTYLLQPVHGFFPPSAIIATAAMLPGELEDVICLLSVCVAHLLLDPQSKTLFQAKFVKKKPPRWLEKPGFIKTMLRYLRGCAIKSGLGVQTLNFLLILGLLRPTIYQINGN